jgi:hypothetical protein
MWGSWWNENWQGKPKCSEKTRPSDTFSITNPKWPDWESYPDRPHQLNRFHSSSGYWEILQSGTRSAGWRLSAVPVPPCSYSVKKWARSCVGSEAVTAALPSGIWCVVQSGRSSSEFLRNCCASFMLVAWMAYSSILKMESVCSSETSMRF